jgi:hypothetical protein
VLAWGAPAWRALASRAVAWGALAWEALASRAVAWKAPRGSSRPRPGARWWRWCATRTENEGARSLIGVLLAARPDLILEVGLPFWRPPEGTSYLATYGASRASAYAAAEMLGLAPA